MALARTTNTWACRGVNVQWRTPLWPFWHEAILALYTRCLRKPIPQYAGSVPARCGYFARTFRFRSVRKPFPLAAEPFPQHAGIVSAGCGYNSRSVRTRYGMYFSATVSFVIRHYAIDSSLNIVKTGLYLYSVCC